MEKSKRQASCSIRADAEKAKRPRLAKDQNGIDVSRESGGNGMGVPPRGETELAFWLTSPAVPLKDKVEACLPLLARRREVNAGSGQAGRLSRAVLQFATGALVRAADSAANRDQGPSAAPSVLMNGAEHLKLWKLVEWALHDAPGDVAAVISTSVGHILRAVHSALEKELRQEQEPEGHINKTLSVCTSVMQILRTDHNFSFNPKSVSPESAAHCSLHVNSPQTEPSFDARCCAFIIK